MSNLFKQIQPPTRDPLAKEYSLRKIKEAVNKQKKQWHWPYYSTLVSTAVLLLIIIGTLLPAEQSLQQTTATTNKVETIYVVEQSDLYDKPRLHMDAFYYTDKLKVAKKETRMLEQILTRATTISSPLTPPTDYMALLVKMVDGSKQYWGFIEGSNELLLIDGNLVVSLTNDEYITLKSLIHEHDQSIPTIVKLTLILFLFIVLQYSLEKISPLRKIEVFAKPRKRTIAILVFSFTFMFLFIIVGFSLYLYSGHNMLFVFATFLIIFLLSRLIRWYKAKPLYSILEVPVQAIFYTLIVYIYYL